MNKTVKSISRRKVANVVTTKRSERFIFSWKKILSQFLFVIFCSVVLLLGLHGLPGNPGPKALNSNKWTVNGPFESSNDRGRYALLYSVIENHSFQFSLDLAGFAAPDLAYTHGQFVSLFAPGVSFLVMPGYLIGKYFGDAQVGTFAVIAFFAVCNAVLIRAIGKRIGAHSVASTLAALTFLFASPAFAYATTLSQHHVSTFLILSAIYLLVRFNSVLSLIGIWILCGVSITVDYPNFFMMLPIGIFAFAKVFAVKKGISTLSVDVRIPRLLSLMFIAIPLVFFLLFNKLSYGNPFQLSGTLERVNDISKAGKPVLERDLIVGKQKPSTSSTVPKPTFPDKTTIGFFQSRILMNGFYVHFLSPDRGMIIFSPVILLGFVGLVFSIRKKQPYAALFTAVMGFNILLYSMWDDPYGGWAFGSRYLIPSYAMLALFIALFLTYIRKKNLYLLIFLTFFCYSVAVNTLGAVTSINNPPKVEADVMSHVNNTVVEYTYMRNVYRLNANTLDSFVFQTFAKQYLSGWDYFIIITSSIVVIGSLLLILLRGSRKDELYV